LSPFFIVKGENASSIECSVRSSAISSSIPGSLSLARGSFAAAYAFSIGASDSVAKAVKENAEKINTRASKIHIVLLRCFFFFLSPFFIFKDRLYFPK